MNRLQKTIVRDVIIIVVITVVAIVTMVNLRGWINRSEAMRAMEALGQKVIQYRKEHGLVPPESYILRIKDDLQGHLRLAGLHYRARWIDFEYTPDEILAYTKTRYHSLFLGSGFIVLRLDGHVEWMNKEELEKLLAQQQSPDEIQMLQD